MADINSFAIDCNRKQEQIAFLQSLRRSPDDMLFSLSGWTGEDKQVNWIINYHLRTLANYC